MQEPQQVYSVNERDCEVDPTHQQQQMIQSDDLSLSTKRQCLVRLYTMSTALTAWTTYLIHPHSTGGLYCRNYTH